VRQRRVEPGQLGVHGAWRAAVRGGGRAHQLGLRGRRHGKGPAAEALTPCLAAFPTPPQLDDPFSGGAAADRSGSDQQRGSEGSDPDVWAPPARVGPSARPGAVAARQKVGSRLGACGGVWGCCCLRPRGAARAFVAACGARVVALPSRWGALLLPPLLCQPEERLPNWARAKGPAAAGGLQQVPGPAGPSGRRRAVVSNAVGGGSGGGGNTRAVPARVDSWQKRNGAVGAGGGGGGVNAAGLATAGGGGDASARRGSAGAGGVAAGGGSGGGGGAAAGGGGGANGPAAGVRRAEYMGPDGDLVANLERDMLDRSPGVRWAPAAAAACGGPGRLDWWSAVWAAGNPRRRPCRRPRPPSPRAPAAPPPAGGATSRAWPRPSACWRRPRCCP
jgi:hypothetical protein